MSQYETDDEKVEAIKKWWKDNGLSVAAGIVIGLLVVFGWRTYSGYRDDVAAAASNDFDQLLATAAAGQTESALKQAELLDAEYGSTPYAALAGLVEAKVQYEAGNSAAAITALEGVISDAPDPAIKRLAALRLARIQVADGQLDAAAATLAAHDDGVSLAGDFALVRGDIAAGRGDTATARREYEQAIAAGSGLSQLIRLKLDNLPGDAG